MLQGCFITGEMLLSPLSPTNATLYSCQGTVECFEVIEMKMPDSG